MKKGRIVTDLPCYIIDMILGGLPVRDAVRTSAVCREWRNKWKSVPKLVFDVDFDVDRLLLLHHGNINAFAIYNKCRADVIDRWIASLQQYDDHHHSKLQDFTLHYSHEPNYSRGFMDRHYYGYILPPPFFSFKNLTHLSLCRCRFQPPPHFTGFSSLVSLDLQRAGAHPDVLKQLVAGSPLLETLSMVDCTCWLSFEVECPRLRCFRFHGPFENIRFRNSPLLARVSLSGGCLLTTVSFHLLPSLEEEEEKLHLHPHLLQILDIGAIGGPTTSTAYLDYSFKILDLLMYLDCVHEVDCALRSARTSPHLHKLRVSFCGDLIEEAVIEFIRGQETPDDDLNHLRKVEICDFSGTEPQIEFVRYLLASAAGLEQLLVISLPCSAIISDSRLMDMLKQFPHASPTVQLTVEKRRGRMRICYTYY